MPNEDDFYQLNDRMTERGNAAPPVVGIQGVQGDNFTPVVSSVRSASKGLRFMPIPEAILAPSWPGCPPAWTPWPAPRFEELCLHKLPRSAGCRFSQSLPFLLAQHIKQGKDPQSGSKHACSEFYLNKRQSTLWPGWHPPCAGCSVVKFPAATSSHKLE